MSGTSLIRDSLLPLRTKKLLIESDSFPYTVVDTNVVGVSILNQHATNTVTATFTLTDTSSFAIPVLAGGSYGGEYESTIATVAISGTTPDFTIELLRRHN